MRLALLHSALAASSLALLGVARALSIDASDVVSPADIVGEHQSLQKTWTIASLEELEKLHLLVPGRVFIDIDANLAAPAVAGSGDESKSSSASGSSNDDIAGVEPSASSNSLSSETGDDSDDDIVFPTPAPTKRRAPAAANATHAPSNVTGAPLRTHAPPLVADANSSSGSDTSAGNTVALTTQLRRALKEDDSDSDSESDDDSDDKSHKKHSKPKEAVVAKIVVTGNSSALIDLFEVAPLHPHSESGLRLHLKNADASAEGFVLTQIVLTNKNYLRHVSTILSNDVIIGDAVLVENDKDATVKILVSGASNVFVKSSANVLLDSLEVDVAGEGSVQIQVPTLTLEDTLSVNVAGSGRIGLLAGASFKSAQIKAVVSGVGNVVVQTGELTSEELTAAVYGEGSVSVASAGSVTSEKLTLSGSGNLFVGSIVAQRASASVWGVGDVIVQVTEKLKVTTTFAGSVGYVGEPPAHVKTSKWLFWRSDIVYPAAENTVLKYDVAAAPARYPLYTSLVTKQTHCSEGPMIEVTTSAAPSYLAAASTRLSAAAHGPSGFLVVSMVVTTLAVAGLAAKSFHKRRMRRHYRPLV